MNARLRQHYLQLWELADSLERDWWQEQEKASLRQTLRDAVATDANLASIVDITASNFLEQLTNRLQVLAVSQPEISQSNLPPAETLKQIQQTQNHLFHLPQETNFTFHHGKKGGPNVTDTELQTILTKHGLIDTNGKFAATINETDRRAAAQEISQKSTAHFHRQQLEKEITSLFEGQAPANLFAREFFGTPEGVPGVASFLAEKISQKSADYLGQRISAHQHGHFDPLAPNSQKALNRAVEETRDHIAANRLFTSQEQATIGRQINAMITSSPKFRLLTARNQQLVLNRVNETLGQISSVSQTPSQIISFKVRATKHGRPALTSFQAGYRESERKTKKFEAIPNRPQNVVSTALRAAGRGLNSPEVQLSTRNISRNISDFSRDPFGATLRYPYYSLVYLLPKPITDLFLPSKDSLRSKVKLIYGVSISPDAQRQLLENFGKNILKSIGSKVGFYTRDFKGDYHFAPVAALGWVSDKAFTGLGEGVGWVFGKIPGVGKTLKESISRSVGSKRNRQKSLLTSWMVSLPLALLKLVPGGIWALAKKIPFVAKSWANLSVSTKLSLFKFLRIGKGVLGSLSKALPHGLISGGLGYLATGNPLAGGGLGLTDLTFHFLRNLGQVTEIGNWAVGAHTTIFGKAFGFAISNRWFYLPIKGSLAGLLVSQFALPALGINVPVWGHVLSTVAGGGLEYGLQVGIKPLLVKFVSPTVAKIGGTISHAVGTILQFILNPGTLLGYQLAILLGLGPFQATLAALGGGAVFWGAVKLIFGHFVGFGGWLGYAAAIAINSVFGLTGWPAFLVQTGLASLGVYLQYLGIQALGDWFLGSVSGAFSAGLHGAATVSAGISAGAVAAMAIGIIIVVAGTILIIFIFSSVFIEQKALSSEFISADIPIKKTFVSAEKNDAGEIIALNYELTYGLSSNVNGTLNDIQIRDRFKHTGKPKIYVFHLLDNFWFRYQILTLGDNEPSSFEPCDPTIIGDYFLWYHKPPPEISPDEKGLCPEEFGPLSPGQKKTITMRLALKKPLNKILTKKEDRLCNTFGVSGKISSKENREFSSISICVNNEGKISTAAAAELARMIVSNLDDCGIDKITKSNLTAAENCLLNADIPITAINEISASTNYFGEFQCLGLVDAVEAATGGSFQDFDLGTAKLYWRKLAGYRQIAKSNYLNIMPGDIFVWTNGSTGHLAMVVETVYDFENKLVKIEIAEVIGTDGTVRFREIAVTDLGIALPGLAGWQRRDN